MLSIVHPLIQGEIPAELDPHNEKINDKIREHSLQKIPLILAIGCREAENQEVSMQRSADQTEVLWSQAFEDILQEAKPPC